MSLNIITECFIDTHLITIISPPKFGKSYNHQKGCPNVLKLMQEKFTSDFALGIIDKDKKIHHYTNEFTILGKHEDKIELWKHPSRNHFLIFICPAIENWIINSISKLDKKLSDYDIPNDFKQFLNITKTSKSLVKDKYSANFKRIFRDIGNSNIIEVKLLIFWLNYLNENRYKVDIDFLKSNSIEISSISNN